MLGDVRLAERPNHQSASHCPSKENGFQQAADSFLETLSSDISDQILAEKNKERRVYVTKRRQEEEKEKTKKGAEEKGKRHSHNERPKDKKPNNKMKHHV